MQKTERKTSLPWNGDIGPESRLGWLRAEPAGRRDGEGDDRPRVSQCTGDAAEDPERWDGLS